MTTDDQIELLVDEAHKLFGNSSVHEVIDLEHEEALKFIVEHYGPVDMDRFDRYMKVVEKVKEITAS